MSDLMLLGVLRMPVPYPVDAMWLHQLVDRARQAADRIEADADEIERLRTALRELVALEDMRLRLRSLHERGHGTDYEHYHKGLPKAWEDARAVLLGHNGN